MFPVQRHGPAFADAFDFYLPSEKVGRRLASIINVVGYR